MLYDNCLRGKVRKITPNSQPTEERLEQQNGLLHSINYKSLLPSTNSCLQKNNATANDCVSASLKMPTHKTLNISYGFYHVLSVTL
mmetsp:Transcript_18100/g.38046  ORF Transcript_18100/g.38046 Transcript_18100/m.38046 type:complete len:86 (+) Transcript_18100:515-772(+)